MTEIQDRGEQARQAAGIDGTAGDAQDVPHPYIPDGGSACVACGLAQGYAKHADHGTHPAAPVR
jgi:hypothetical protein